MNRTEITKYLINPELVANASSTELRRLVEIYPYCESLHWIYLRSLYINDDAIFEDELMKYGMHISNRRLFYNYLTFIDTTNLNSPPVLGGGDYQLSILNSQLSTPDYFALEQNPEHKQSLQQLAAQLKAARLARQSTPKAEKNEKPNTSDKPDSPTSQTSPTSPTTPTNPSNPTNKPQLSTEISEENAKKLIKEQKYSEAIEILRAISLNNPKKSANFALQIKFLETIINNHNKK